MTTTFPASEGAQDAHIHRERLDEGLDDATRDARPSTRRRKGPVPGTAAAQRGGRAVVTKYGVEFLREIGRKGGAAAAERYDSAFYGAAGRKGGETTKRRHGPEFYREIGRKGGLANRGKPKPKPNAKAKRASTTEGDMP